MAKGAQQKPNSKKPAAKSLKEKREDKKAKKSPRGTGLGS